MKQRAGTREFESVRSHRRFLAFLWSALVGAMDGLNLPRGRISEDVIL
jgi:hypothetical protein